MLRVCLYEMINLKMKRFLIVTIFSQFLFACALIPEKPQALKTFETFTLDIEGPETSELSSINPFTHYRVMVEFIHPDKTVWVRGYYAAAQKASENSADRGRLWQAKFTPDLAGKWQYKVHFDSGSDIALSQNMQQGTATEFDGVSGVLMVSKNKTGRGFLRVKNGYFYPQDSTRPILKVGANSPENLFGYVDFDGTYRAAKDQKDEGKAQNTKLHQFQPHIQDWKNGDISWQQGKGKGLVGALNYLSDQQMNAVYLITMNIKGDGKDTWPYVDHNTLNRFDVSKLAQWQKVFEHMQNKGLLMHVILQETENETLLDGGDTGYYRKLYLNEMIARFSHFSGVIWNIGEENGPVKWSPVGQTPEQVIEMAKYIKNVDPYQHPVLVHSHASAKHKEETLTGLLGAKEIDGLSLQVDQPARVVEDIQTWRKKSQAAGHLWAISMDEIGIWHTGARPDKDNPTHQDMRTQVLWPALFTHASGVEWYFGYRYDNNDLDAEDWRSRDDLWRQTALAKAFFNTTQLETLASNCAVNSKQGYFCLTDETGSRAVMYVSDWQHSPLNLTLSGRFKVRFFNPISGQWTQHKQLLVVEPGKMLRLDGIPQPAQADWAIELIRN